MIFMEIVRHCDIEKDLKKLGRYPTPKESLEAWERLFISKGLRETPGIDSYKGFGNEKIYKARVVPLGENCGKSKGYRIVFQIIENSSEGTCKIICFSRHGIHHDEQELVGIIKMRL